MNPNGVAAPPILADGLLSVARRSGETAPVLAIHGISSTRKIWNWLLAEAPDVDLIAPDLRGRGDSYGLDGSSSIRQHVDDLIGVLDALEVDRVHVIGMSFGGAVAVHLAAALPEQVMSLTLLDGGLPIPRPPAAPAVTRALLAISFESTLSRAATEWGSLTDYAKAFVAQSAPLLDPSDPNLLDYLAHDLVCGAAGGRVRLDPKAVLDDAVDLTSSDSLQEALVRLRVPAARPSIATDTSQNSSPLRTGSKRPVALTAVTTLA